ncbi:discoidin domain-containing protein [Paenibacillus sp. EKM212P]|uniref:NADase-type glycan-binding domain-containing protein n=1 Tax=Paenibacillus sp. EKM212P TaxID=1683680 RepID=UPI0016277779|nr:discoidin domain-containing protein [Paenibacillus sp. EKM212P]KAF6579194.1 discoidin domain-containing protein [Paenibacillus sp. EKM212P]
MNSRKRNKTAVWISKITLFVLIFSMLCGCIQSSESQKAVQERKETHPSVSQSKRLPPAKKAVNWLLFEAENGNMPVDYLADMDDPTGNTYIELDDIIDELYASEGEAYPKNELYLEGFSDDGRRIALCRESQDLNYLIIKIFDLSTTKKLYEFKVPNRDYAVMSPDLRKCVYTDDAAFFYYMNQGQETKALGQLNDGHYLNLPVFSPDGNQFALVDRKRNVLIYDLSQNKQIQQIKLGIEGIQIEQWLYNNQLLLSSYDNDKLYMFNIQTGEKKQLMKATESPALTLDNHRVAYVNSKGEMQQQDIQTGLSIKYSNVFYRIGYNVSPTQWVQTTTDLMKYRKNITAQKIIASSTLPDQAGNSYAARNIMDGDASTAWCEGVKGNGIGEWIEIDFGSMQELKGFELINGLAKSSNAFQVNNRVKRMKLEFSNGQTIMVDNDFLSNAFPNSAIHTSFVKITIVAVEQGSKYHDTCMSEIRFF